MDEQELERLYSLRHAVLKQLAENLERETRRCLDGVAHIDRISFRAKGVNSYVDKVFRRGKSYAHPLVEIEDQVGGRVIVFFLSDIEVVSQKILRTFNRVEQSFRQPERDEEFGYQSEHFILNIPPQLKPQGWSGLQDMPGAFEFQIRTVFMHAYAEPQHDFGYKSASELSKDIRRELAWIAASAWGADRAYQSIVDRIAEASLTADASS